MSLIEEALRRVQDPTLKGRTTPPPVPRQDSTAPRQDSPEPPAHSWTAPPQPAGLNRANSPQAPQLLIAVALVILVVTAALMAGGVFWMMRTRIPSATGARSAVPPRATAAAQPATSQPPQMSQMSAPQETAEPPAPSVVRAAALPAPSVETMQQDGLRLTGIVEGTGDPYAFINGQIVAVGETVGHFTLISVHDGAAVLRHEDGTDTILRVAR